jgi:hypothetical protein
LSGYFVILSGMVAGCGLGQRRQEVDDPLGVLIAEMHRRQLVSHCCAPLNAIAGAMHNTG